MKTFLVGALLMGLTSLMADSALELNGQITAIDANAKTIVITGVKGAALVQILPYTKIKAEDCGAVSERVNASFDELNVGKLVNAKVYPANMPMPNMNTKDMAPIAPDVQYVADSIKWNCGLSAAY